jgi:glycosyltransferase involved in cell wall biosynthesis
MAPPTDNSTEEQPEICVTVPAYNEDATVAQVVEECRDVLNAAGYDHVILVIDDGSTDETADVAADAGATVVSHHTNRGLGNTFRTGLRHAIETGADIIVNIDADGQYHTEDMRDLIRAVEDGAADMALGTRSVFELDHMPLGKKVGNRIGSLVTSILSGMWVKDAQSGFRAMTRELALSLNLSGTYTYVQESLIQAAHNGFTIKQVPIDFYARESGDSRLISSLRNYIKNAAVIVIRTYRDYRPMRTFSVIAALFFLIAAVPGYQIGRNFLATGAFNLEGRALLVVMLVLGGALTLVFGLLADMLKGQRELQEEILYELREQA